MPPLQASSWCPHEGLVLAPQMTRRQLACRCQLRVVLLLQVLQQRLRIAEAPSLVAT